MAERVPVLIMIQGHEPGARWRLEQTRVTTVGRSSRNQIKLVHPSVSRFHCEISYINGLWYVADLNSKKGTYLNGREVSEREVLKPGDVIRMSRNVFKFELVEEGQSEDEDLRAIREAGAGAGAGPDRATGQEAAGPPAGRAELGNLLRRYAEHLTFVVVAAVVVFGIVFGALAYGEYRVRQVRTAREQQRRERERALQEARALAGEEPLPYAEALPALRSVVERYPGTPQAEKAAELYRRVEARKFQEGMSTVESLVESNDYRKAYAEADQLHGELAAQNLKRLAAEQREFALRLARAGLDRRRQRALAMAEEGDTEAALELYREAIRKMVVTEKMKTEAQEFLGRLQTLQENQEKEEEGGGPEEGAADEEQLRNRMTPPSGVAW